MNAVSLERQTNPSSSDRVIRTGRQHQLVRYAFLLGRLGKNFWIECVVGVGRDIGNHERLIRDFRFICRDRARKTGHHLVVGVEGKEGRFGDHDHDPGNGREFPCALKVGECELRACDEIRHSWIQLLQKGRCRMCFLGKHFPRVVVIENWDFAHP